MHLMRLCIVECNSELCEVSLEGWKRYAWLEERRQVNDKMTNGSLGTLAYPSFSCSDRLKATIFSFASGLPNAAFIHGC